MFFGGRNKPKVNYGRGGGDEDDTPFSLRVSQQRAERERQKLLETTVLKLQSIYRAHRALHWAKVGFRKQFDRQIPSVLAQPTQEAVWRLLQRIVFFFDARVSGESSRLVLLSTLLSRSQFKVEDHLDLFLKLRRMLVQHMAAMDPELLVTSLQLLLRYALPPRDSRFLFVHLRRAIESRRSSSALLNGLVAFALQLVTPESAPEFTAQILSLGELASTLTEALRREVLHRDAAAPCIMESAAARRSTLANVLTLLQSGASTPPPRLAVLLLAQLVTRDEAAIFPVAARDDSDDSEESAEELYMENAGDPEIVALLSPLLRPLAALLTDSGGTDQQLFLSLCALFEVATRRDTAELNQLAFSGAAFLPRLWEFVSGHEAASAPPQATAFFCRVYSQLLTLLDDEEFFAGTMFPLETVVQMITFIKAPVLGLPARSPLKDSLTTLLNRLYERDCRRSFCPPNHWINRALDSEGITRDLINHRLSDSTREVIEKVPFFMPFLTRVGILQRFIEEDRGPHWRERGGGARVTIRREHLFEDSFAVFQRLTRESRLKDALRITFIDAHGLQEAGVDGGGVFREFVQSLVAEGFGSPDLPLFLNTQDNHIYPNPALRAKQYQQYYEFLGIILGKAMYESLLVDVPFASFFLSKLLGKKNTLHDLSSLDRDLYRNLVFMKNYKGADFEDTFGLTFSITDDEFGNKVTRDLIPNGSNIPVTLQNKLYYVYQVAHYRLNRSIYVQSKSFVRGFARFLPQSWLRLFSASELLVLIRGEEGDIDVDEWERNTVYSGGFHPSQPAIQMFWRVVREEMTPVQRRLLLKFVTSCSRPPLRGFASLEPRFCISQRSGGDLYLPTAGTCMNLLKLPRYTSIYSLKRQVIMAIESGSGFELS